jgi:hypothetical protein
MIRALIGVSEPANRNGREAQNSLARDERVSFVGMQPPF